MKKWGVIAIIIIVVVVLAVVGSGVFWYGQKNKPEPVNAPVAENVVGDDNSAEEQEDDELQGEVVSDGEGIDISDWLTYRNEEYGFEVRYPGDYIVKQINNGVYLKHPSYDLVPNVPAEGGAISVVLSDTKIEDHIKAIENTDPPLSRVTSQKEYMLDGVRGIEIISNFPVGLDYYDIFFTYNNKKYLISYGDIGLQYAQEILSTFKFIK